MAARKPGQGSERRQRTLRTMHRWTPAELNALRAAAEAEGLSVAAYVRRETLGDVGPRAARGRMLPEERAVRQLIGQLGYVGNNLNQLTRAVNMGDLERPAELDRALSDVLATIDRCAKVIGRGPP